MSNLLILCILLLMFFYSIFVSIKLFLISKKLKETLNSQSTLLILYDDIKSFKHDFENIVSVIGGFINNNDMEGLKKYYEKLFNDCQKLNSYSVLKPEIINNSGIYNLLVEKFNKAEKKNVNINLECFIDFNKLHMSIYEFTRILGIFIDNAIEAASNSPKKEVNISFRDSKSNNVQIVIIENTYINKNLDTSKIFEKGITSKENHMGIGLWRVKKIIEHNKNINLITTNDDNYFKQQLEIYY